MATLRLILARQPLRLLESAAEPFLAPPPATDSPFASPPCLLALRQGGLRDDLLALAARRGVRGWFDPPLCLFAELPDRLAGEQSGYSDDYERVVLLSAVLREVAPRVLVRPPRTDAFVDAVDRLFGEWIGEGHSPEDLARALRSRADADAFERMRNDELVAAYARYRERLREANRQDRRARLAETARVVRADPGGLAERLGGRREIRLFALHDLRGGWVPLLEALRESPALDVIGIYTSVRLDQTEGLAPDEVIELPEPRGLSHVLFEPGADTAVSADGGPAIRLISAPDAEREVEDVAVRVRALLDRGERPERIAVVARSARPYVDLVLQALDRLGVDATARRRVRFAEIPVVRSVLALLAVARDGWTRHGLVELAQQPYLGVDLDPVILNHIGYRRRVEGLDAWRTAIESLLREAKAQERRREEAEAEERRGNAPPSERVERALADFLTFAERASPLHEQRPLREWIEWLRAAVLGPAWGIERRMFSIPHDRFDVVRVDAAGFGGMRRILDEWSAALDQWGGGDERLDAAGFETRVREMLDGDAALWTETRRGVQVLEGLAAAHRPFDHVFLVGLSSGTFPLPAPRRSLLGPADLEALAAAGLRCDTRERWDVRERALFRALVAGGARSLTLSWPRLDARGAETGASVFIDETIERTNLEPEVIPTQRVSVPGMPVLRSAEAARFAEHALRIERIRETGELSPWNGLIEDPELREYVQLTLGENYVWSPTQLESYAKCAWSWFSERLLRTTRLQDPDIDIDPRARGSILHDALHRFFDAARERTGGPVVLLPQDLGDWALPLAGAALDQAIEAADDDVWLGQPELRKTKRAELRRMLERYLRLEAEANARLLTSTHWMSTRVLRTGVAEHEVPFDNLALNLGSTTIMLRGTIDRVEVGVDARVSAHDVIAAVDYKTTRWSTPGSGDKEAWDDGVVLQVPLYAHALTQLRPGTRVARVEYRAIRSGERVHSLELLQVKRDRGSHVTTEDSKQRAKMAEAIEAAGRHVERARAGEYRARPAPSCMCPSFCHAWEICRVKGGPQKKW